MSDKKYSVKMNDCNHKSIHIHCRLPDGTDDTWPICNDCFEIFAPVSLLAKLVEALSAAEAMNKKLAKFFVTAIQCSFEGCDYDGGGMQDDALAIGLIEECTPPDDEEGPWYRIVDDVKKLIEGESVINQNSDAAQ